MNNLRNKVQLIGHLGADPEITILKEGKKLVKLSLATNESYKNAGGEWVNNTQWHTLTAWDNLADIIGKNLKKGNEIAIEGKLLHRNYLDKDGVKRYVTDIQINELLILDHQSEK